MTSGFDDIVTGALSKGFGADAARAKADAAWVRIRRDTRDDKRALRTLAKTLRRGGQAACAGMLLDHVAAAMPDESWPLAQAATHGMETGAHHAALRQAQVLMQRFPQQSAGYRIGLDAMLKLDQTAEAEALLAEAEQRFGATEFALLARISLCQKRQNWLAALEAAERLRALAPHRPDGIANAAMALSRLSRGAEAEAMIAEACTRFPGAATVLKCAAHVAEGRDDMETALARWSVYRARFPRSRAGYVSPLQILVRTRRVDLAGTLLEDAAAAFPRDPKVRQLLASVAGREGRWQEADGHWHALIELHPDNPDYALSSALAPIGHRSGRRKRIPEVLRRLDALHERFPDFVEGFVAHVGVLRDAGMLDVAETRAGAWSMRFPDNTALALARANVAEDAGRFDDALRQIEALRARAAASPQVDIAHIRVLSRAGREDDAEHACAQALETYPKAKEILSEYARLASRRGDWAQALERWREAQRRRPNDPGIAHEISFADTELAGQEAVNAFADTPAAENMFARFESLGGTATGCEFGMVQRKFGSEGIGLLRWTKSDVDDLIAALEQNFDGVGDEAHTDLLTTRISADREEYVTADKRFGMKSNTFVKVADAPFDKMFVQTCRRLRFLRGKLVEDLKAAEKIFVFKMQEAESDEALRRLYAAARRYGPVILMCVMVADADNPRGSIRVVEPGLLVGYIGYFIKAGDGGARGIDFVTWKTLVQAADELRAATAPPTAQAA